MDPTRLVGAASRRRPPARPPDTLETMMLLEVGALAGVAARGNAAVLCVRCATCGRPLEPVYAGWRPGGY